LILIIVIYLIFVHIISQPFCKHSTKLLEFKNFSSSFKHCDNPDRTWLRRLCEACNVFVTEVGANHDKVCVFTVHVALYVASSPKISRYHTFDVNIGTNRIIVFKIMWYYITTKCIEHHIYDRIYCRISIWKLIVSCDIKRHISVNVIMKMGLYYCARWKHSRY